MSLPSALTHDAAASDHRDYSDDASHEAHTCPYCHRNLRSAVTRPAPFQPATTRDCTVGLVLGFAVVGFVDIGVFVRRDPTPIGFGSNLIVAAVLTVLLALWYREMRAEVARQNAEAYGAWQKQMDDHQHLYRCQHCALTFHR